MYYKGPKVVLYKIAVTLLLELDSIGRYTLLFSLALKTIFLEPRSIR
jgi:hypothetical protein